MQKIIGVTELQRKFRPFFESVVRKRTPLILTRGSRPEAVLIPYEDYLRYQQMEESEVLASIRSGTASFASTQSSAKRNCCRYQETEKG
jgi:prevent-host-death family protein